ncbi:hypothetical protein F5Y16DRAFT_418343 [Xylariaceae sp. FL0255]|nr:hypothetical protein F5Y16DRAFT_418343 [Xylariaceae sp. FL0255]
MVGQTKFKTSKAFIPKIMVVRRLKLSGISESRTLKMEHTLHCNILKCRKELGDRALVTTCYHIFCGDCAGRLGLAGQRRDRETACPACGTPLVNPDDAVITNLKLSEDYKTSVLSGLSPNVIMDCATRALAFWAYQVTQEIVYQQQMAKTLTAKYSSLNVHLDKVVNDANAEISNFHAQLKSTEMEREELTKKYDELLYNYKSQNRKLLQTQELYDKLKRKAMLGQVQDAAEDAVESRLHVPSLGQVGGMDEPQDAPLFSSRETFYGPGGLDNLHGQRQSLGTYNPQQPSLPLQAGNWPRTIGAQSDVPPITPSTHRRRMVDDSTNAGLSTVPGVVVGTSRVPRNHMNSRTAPANVLSNNPQRLNNSFSPARMSSGLKVGQRMEGGVMAAPSKPRTIQRPSAFSSYNGNAAPMTARGVDGIVDRNEWLHH